MAGLCPFHGEKSPSFSVNAEQGLYYCFGCQAKGDVITFVREIEHLDFVGAVEWLAGKAGITLRYTDQDEGEGRKRRARLIDAMEQAVDVVPRAAAVGARRRRGPWLPALARPRRRRRAAVPARLGARRLGRAGQGAEAARRRARATPGSASSTSAAGSRTSSAAGCCSRSSTRRATRWPSAAASCPAPTGRSTRTRPRRTIYAKSKVLYGLNWAKDDDRRRRRGHRVRGLHRRHRLRRRRACPGPSPRAAPRSPRSTFKAAQELRPAGRAGLRRRRRRARRGRAVLRVGAASTRSTWRWPPCPPGSIPADLARSDPERAADGGRAGHAVPRLPGRPGARRGHAASRPRAGPARPRRRWP